MLMEYNMAYMFCQHFPALTLGLITNKKTSSSFPILAEKRRDYLIFYLYRFFWKTDYAKLHPEAPVLYHPSFPLSSNKDIQKDFLSDKKITKYIQSSTTAIFCFFLEDILNAHDMQGSALYPLDKHI